MDQLLFVLRHDRVLRRRYRSRSPTAQTSCTYVVLNPVVATPRGRRSGGGVSYATTRCRVGSSMRRWLVAAGGRMHSFAPRGDGGAALGGTALPGVFTGPRATRGIGHDLDALRLGRARGPRGRAPRGGRGSRPRAGRASARASSGAAATGRARAASSATRLPWCLPAKRISSYASPAISGRSRTRVAISQYQAGRPKNANTNTAITITQSRNAVPQRGWMSE